MTSQVENQIGQLSAYSAYVNNRTMNNHPPLAATNSLVATVSSKTHYYRAENRSLHISVQDLFGTADFGKEWFEDAHGFRGNSEIRVTNRDTGNAAHFKYSTPAIQHNGGVGGGSAYKQVNYVGTTNTGLDIELVVWENQEDLRGWVAYMHDKSN